MHASIYSEISFHGRTAGAAKLAARPDTVRKDLDLKAPFRLGWVLLCVCIYIYI